MSNPNQARRVSAQIFFQGVDITGSMRPYLLSATYTDREEDGTDDLQLKLQDRDDVWLKKWLTDVIDAAASAGSLSASAKSEAASTAKSYKVTAKSGLNVRPQYELRQVRRAGLRRRGTGREHRKRLGEGQLQR